MNLVLTDGVANRHFEHPVVTKGKLGLRRTADSMALLEQLETLKSLIAENELDDTAMRKSSWKVPNTLSSNWSVTTMLLSASVFKSALNTLRASTKAKSGRCLRQPVLELP